MGSFGLCESFAYLSYPSTKERANEEFKSLKLCLEDDQPEIGLRIHVPSLLFYHFQLAYLKSANVIAGQVRSNPTC